MNEQMPFPSTIANGAATPPASSRANDWGLGGEALASVRATAERVLRAMAEARREQTEALEFITRPEALADVAIGTRRETATLRRELCSGIVAYTRQLQSAGMRPEEMLVRVKAVVRDAMPLELEASAARDLMEDVVRASIDAYYAPNRPR